MRIIHKLCFCREAILYGFMFLGLFHDPSKEEDYLRNRMGGSFWSTFQKVQRIHELELSYASFMLSLCYHLCVLYIDYASAKRKCHVCGFMLISLFRAPSKEEEYLQNRMGGLVWSTFQKVQRIHELGFLYASFMLSLRYRLCGFYTDYASTKK